MNQLIERYVYDVTRRLPEKQRQDVAQELTAEIHDMVEDQADGKKPTKQHVFDVLVKMGSPSSLADKYRDRPRYVIGPDYYEPYIGLLRTLFLIVLPILLFIVWMNEAMSTSHTVLTMFSALFDVALQTSVHIFFWTTLSFWFVQKVADGQPHDHNWSPEDLPNMPAGRSISRNESYVAIAWCVVALGAVQFQIPAVYAAIGPSDVPQFFAPEMWPVWTLGMLAVVALGLAVEIVKFIVGGWTRLTVTLITLVNLATIAYFTALLWFGPSIVNPEFAQLVSKTVGDGSVASVIDSATTIGIGVIMAICVWEIGEAIYKYKKGGK